VTYRPGNRPGNSRRANSGRNGGSEALMLAHGFTTELMVAVNL